jgi:capsular polysaccharide transport system permease protein
MSAFAAIAEVDPRTPDPTAEDMCRDSGVAFSSGDIPAARRLVKLALEAAPEDEATLRYASWLFSSLGDDDETVACFSRLERREALSATQHMVASAAHARRGDFAAASAHALRALALEPEDPDPAQTMHACAMLNLAGRAREAAMLLTKAARRDRNNPYWLRELSASATQLGMADVANGFALAAWRLDPENIEYGLHVAGQLMSRGDFEHAREILRGLLATHGRDVRIFSMLAFGACRVGDFAETLAEANRGLEHFPDSVELLMHKGVACCAIHSYSDAADAFLAASRLSGEDVSALRGAFLALVQAGRLEEATPIGAAILKVRPNDFEMAKSLRHVLTQRFVDAPTGGSLDGVALAALKARRGRENLGPREVETNSFRAQIRIMSALITRETRTRFGRSSLGYLWALFEPLAHIAIMVTLINTFAHGAPPIGDSFAVFYFTGIIPYHVFTHTATQLAGAIPANRPLLHLPPVTIVNVFVSRAVLELVSELAVALVLLTAFNVFGLSATPRDPLLILGAVLFLWSAATGMGMLNAVINEHFKAWEKIWGACMALLYFASGTFYIPRMMPGWLRDILAWNPILQAIEMTRAGFFHETAPPWLDIPYLAIVAVILPAVGLFLERLNRSQLLAGE